MVTFNREKDLSRSRMIEGIHGPKRALAKLARFDGVYLRFTGQVRVERHGHGDRAEEFSGEGIWDLMYFGPGSMSAREEVARDPNKGCE